MGIQVQCLNCSVKLKGFKDIASSFLKHLKNSHEDKFKDFQERKAKIKSFRRNHSVADMINCLNINSQ